MAKEAVFVMAVVFCSKKKTTVKERRNSSGLIPGLSNLQTDHEVNGDVKNMFCLCLCAMEHTLVLLVEGALFSY